MEIKDRLKKARLIKGLTQLQLSAMVGAAQATINKLESGQIKNPSYELAVKIANALGEDVNTLFGDESIKNTASILETEKDKLKALALHALEVYFSNEVFFNGMTVDENSTEELKNHDEYVNLLRKFKRGVSETLVTVGFCTREEITEFKNYINPNNKIV